MVATQPVSTSAGPVEILQIPGGRPPVLLFPGGHCSAATDCGRSLYAELGHGVISFSRPGYGGTRVGRLTAAEFAPLVSEVCEQIGITTVAASVGVSFGGLQAVHVAAGQRVTVQRLVLQSCAPSGFAYPDSRAESVLGSLVFAPPFQGLVWSSIRALVRSDAGLRMMMSQLSTLPVRQWWDQWSEADRDEARGLFRSMHSGSGFVNDLRQAHARDAATRRAAISTVPCPTLITASRHDGGVSFAHAEDFMRVIPNAKLVEIPSPSHLFWIGAQETQLASILAAFLRG